jgi:pyruvate/2-oxoglutarate dehydrogenase complex dihydrolipoamide acyltransferase (E2) component
VPTVSETTTTARGEITADDLPKARQSHARRVAEAAATIPTILVSVAAPAASIAAVTHACAQALREQPAVNGAWRDGRRELYSRVNVGIVVETADGPVTPTLFDADERSAEELAELIAAARARAGSGEITAPELAGGTFTLLAHEADVATPFVTPGQAAALAVGRTGTLALAADHRALTHGEAAAFLARVREVLDAG